MRTIGALLIPLALAAALPAGGAGATNGNGQYDDSAYAAWFAGQFNKDGGACCNLADGERYDGAYTMNPDGTVTLDTARYAIVIEAFKVLDGSQRTMPDGTIRGGPNPTGHAIVWASSEQLTQDASNIYCFSPGPLE